MKIHSYVMVPSENGPIFYQIKKIFYYDDKYYLILSYFIDVFLNEHNGLYEIISPLFNYSFIKSEELYGCYLTHIVKTSNKKMYFIKTWL